MERCYAFGHSPIDFYFRQSPRDFVVDEIPLYPFAEEGEHLVVRIRKKNLSTWQLLDLLAHRLGIRVGDIGYAGLKDKNAQTKQYISLPRRCEEALDRLEHEGIKILEKHYHTNKLRIGHLKGNRFFIRLKKVTPVAATKIDQVLKRIRRFGIPNYFGFQRFGIDGENYHKGKMILEGKLKERNRKLAQMYVNAYQSYLFNGWLAERLRLSLAVENLADHVGIEEALGIDTSTLAWMREQKHPMKLLQGDVLMHYPYGKAFYHEESMDWERLERRDITIGGLLSGERALRAQGVARQIEEPYDTITQKISGARRFGWIFPEEMEGEYKPQEAWYELHFTLPKGSYATVLIEEIAKRPIQTDEGENG